MLVILWGGLQTPAYTAPSATQVKTKVRQLKQNEKVLEALRKKTRILKEKEKQSKETLADIQQNLERASKAFNTSQQKYEVAHKQVLAVTKQIQSAEKDWEDHLDASKNRLREMYKARHYASINLLLESQNFSSFVRRVMYLRYMAKQDQDMLNNLKLQREKLSRMQYQQMLKRQILGREALEKAETTKRYEFHKEKEEEYLKRIQKDREFYEKEVRAIEAESRRITQMVQAYLASQGVRVNISLGTGRFTNPCPSAVLTSGFGPRIHPIWGASGFHSGLDMAAGSGSPIYAADDGRVIDAGWMGGYGKAVVIDHGKGISTLYGHTSAFYVRAGEMVRKGQQIAAVGSTGFSTGPHLHWEVRRNGEPTDPSPWLR